MFLSELEELRWLSDRVKHQEGMEAMVSVCRATRAIEAAGSYFPVILHKGHGSGEGGPTTWLGGGTGREGCAKA